MEPINLNQVQVVIPALDEEATIGAVVGGLRERGLGRIRVVDNGSRDRTAEIARATGAEVIAEPRRGYGQACWTGSAGLAGEVEWLLFADADGSDDLDDVPRMLAAAADGADFVLGDRRARREGRAVMTPVQCFGNGLATTLIRLGWGRAYHDLGPLRLIRRSLYERIAMEDRGFGWTIEMQVRAAELGARIVELPVGYGPRRGGRSKISGTIKGSVQAGTIILGTLAKLWGRKLARRQAAWRGTAGMLLVAGALMMMPFGDFARLGVVPWFLIGAAVMGAGFAASWAVRSVSAAWFWVLAVALRLALVPMVPGDDVWRFLWEGRVQLAGFSPYLHAPDDPALAELRTGWWGWINHPGLTTIYPPLTQLVFRAVAAVGAGVAGLKLVFIAADLAVCALLSRRFGYASTLLYAWNPLVVYSTAGGAHHESLFVLPMVAGWLAWERARHGPVSGLWLGLSVAAKLVSAPLVAWCAWRGLREGRWRSAVLLLAAGVLPMAAGVAWFRLEFGALGPLAPASFVEKARGMDLVPWLVSLVWEGAPDTNGWIALAFAPVAALVFFMTRRLRDFAESYLTLMLMFAPSVHAWYFVWLAPWAVASRNLGIRLVSLGAFAYFWVWQGMAQTGEWTVTPAMRACIWLPLLAGMVRTRWRREDA